MHQRNIYSQPLQFEELAQAYPPLLEHLIPAHPPSRWKTIDFHNEHAQRCLTQALLYRDFRVQLTLPEDRLCPAVPNRLNYVLWIQDIVQAHRFLFREDPRTIRGIDIGTGASVIYPLLACKMEPSWDFVVTEIDEKSYASAERNIKVNQMQNRIQLLRAASDKPILFPLEDYTGPPFDFVMCNPPFYSSRAEVARSTEVKELPPNGVCTGADIEMIYPPGGEAAFVGQMVDESERYQLKCRWYTAMLGKLSTVHELVIMLRKRSVRTYAITEFVQGQTRRWGIAWSFTNEHLPDSIARISVHPSNALYSLMPPRNTLDSHFTISFNSIDASYLQTALLGVCSMIRVSATERPLILEEEQQPKTPLTIFRLNPILIQANSNTWSRRERRRQNQMGEREGSITPQTAITLMCSVQWLFDLTITPAAVVLQSQWVFGDDRNMFESLVGHIVRKVSQSLGPYSPRPQDYQTPTIEPGLSETRMPSY